MRGGARSVLAGALAGLVVVGGAGCTKLKDRTDAKTLDGAVSHAFRRSYAAAYRMTVGRPRGGIVRYARVRCHPLGPQPRGERGWSWRCGIFWIRRDRRVGRRSSYRVSVDPRGCFHAVTGDFPARLHERALNRPAANPLVSIRSCP